jgi:sugar/nucleoside kinase (ribokinase family)
MSKIICIGSASKDIFFPTGEGIITETPQDLLSQKKITFELGAKYNIDERYEALGGCAANVAVGLSRLGVQVSCYAMLGDDLAGKEVKNKLGEEKVNTELIEVHEGFMTDLSAIVVDKASGERTIFTSREAGGKLEVSPEKIKNSQWIFIGDVSNGWESNFDIITETAKSEDIKLAINPREKAIHDNVEKVIEAIKHSKILFVNKDEAIEIVSGLHAESKDKLNDEIYLVKSLEKLSPEIVIITDGKRGAWAGDGRKIYYIQAQCSEPVETTGAGDAFTSAFLAAHFSGKNTEDALKWGSANAGEAVKFYGSIKGLLKQDEIEKISAQLKIKEVS